MDYPENLCTLIAIIISIYTIVLHVCTSVSPYFQIQEHREAVTLKIQTGVIQSPMKGQAASSGAGGAGKGGPSGPPKAAAKAHPLSTATTSTDEPPPAEDKPVMKKKRVCMISFQCYFQLFNAHFSLCNVEYTVNGL